MDLTAEQAGESIANTNPPSTLDDIYFAEDSSLGNQSAAQVLTEVKKESTKTIGLKRRRSGLSKGLALKRSNKGRLRRRHLERRSSTRERQKWRSIARTSGCCKSNW